MQEKTFDCLVLSGGGAKGAYGAGAAKAYFAYRQTKKVDRPLCLIGASAGSLNAAALATGSVDDLVGFWRETTTRDVLGVWIRSEAFRALANWTTRVLLRRKGSFSIYRSHGLRSIVERRIRSTTLPDRHLIVAATSYTEGRLKAFYVSELVARFVTADQEHVVDARRLAHFLPAGDSLIDVLLASCAIPVFFPPVEIGGQLFVDGGLGNNTPTREAAYFLRHLAQLKLGTPGDVYCVRLDPPRTRDDVAGGGGLLPTVERSFSIYHEVHTTPIVHAWDRINREVLRHQERMEKMVAWMEGQDIAQGLKDSFREQTRDYLRGIGGATTRIRVPLIVVQPTTELGGILDFDVRKAEMRIRQGYLDGLNALRAAGKIDQAELAELQNAQLWG